MTTRIARHCACGASLDARSTPAATAEALAGEFDQRHSEPGCMPTTATGAARARRRNEARLAAESTEEAAGHPAHTPGDSQ